MHQQDSHLSLSRIAQTSSLPFNNFMSSGLVEIRSGAGSPVARGDVVTVEYTVTSSGYLDTGGVLVALGKIMTYVYTDGFLF